MGYQLRPWYAEGVIWLKPLGAPLELRGRRLDAEAPPLEDFLQWRRPLGPTRRASLIFPTEGCWEIVAQSGNSDIGLRFVMYIHAVHVSS